MVVCVRSAVGDIVALELQPGARASSNPWSLEVKAKREPLTLECFVSSSKEKTFLVRKPKSTKLLLGN